MLMVIANPPAILQAVQAHGRCAIVLSFHNTTTCELWRFQHAVHTRPRQCDVVVLYNVKLNVNLSSGTRHDLSRKFKSSSSDATFDGFLHATRPLCTAKRGIHLVPYDNEGTTRALLRNGYSREALTIFSPYTSGLSKVAWFIWAAGQNYSTFWFSESDVLLEGTWASLINANPLDNGRSEQLVCSRLLRDRKEIHGVYWRWVKPPGCTFCRNHDSKLAGCLLTLSGYTKGLVAAVDSVLRSGSIRAHHELLVPSICAMLPSEGVHVKLQHG